MSRTKRGLFVAVDGPKGAGKTSLLTNVAGKLISSGHRTVLTKEPTTKFNLQNEQLNKGLELAQLLADDRKYHLGKTIEPELRRRKIVITDRYIASSLVFQSMDGVDVATIWKMNQEFRRPDINIFVLADISSLSRRRASRPMRTRLEDCDITQEISLYQWVSEQFGDWGVQTIIVDNSDTCDPVEVAEQITRQVIEAHLG